eukprot:6211170-Pleurochrysis_carterae.AAC.1
MVAHFARADPILAGQSNASWVGSMRHLLSSVHELRRDCEDTCHQGGTRCCVQSRARTRQRGLAAAAVLVTLGGAVGRIPGDPHDGVGRYGDSPIPESSSMTTMIMPTCLKTPKTSII